MNWVLYLRSNLYEILAVIFSLLSVVLTVKENIWLWPTGILGVIFYAIVFWQVNFYAQMGLQVFFIGLQLYGWYEWLYGGKNKSELPITSSTPGLNLLLAAIAVAGTLIVTLLMPIILPSAALPFWDALITVLSLIAQWMLAKKLLENWLVWITVDIISVAVYWYQGLKPSAGLYVVFLILAVLGFIEWQKTYRSLQLA